MMDAGNLSMGRTPCFFCGDGICGLLKYVNRRRRYNLFPEQKYKGVTLVLLNIYLTKLNSV